MEKVQALKALGFELDKGVYKKLLCEKDGTTYTLTCEPHRSGFKVDKKLPDGSETTDGAGKYRNTQIYEKMEEIVKALDEKMKEEEIPPEEVFSDDTQEDFLEDVDVFTEDDFSEVQETSYQEVGEQKKVPLSRPGRRIKNLKPELMEVGTIRAGEKYEKNGKVLPRATEYFRITTKAKNKLGYEIDKEIHAIVGPEPKRLKVRLPCDREDLNFVTFYGKYKASKCECRGDGYSAETFDGDLLECHGEECESFIKGDCKKHGVLSVILEDAPRCGVIWKFRTTSNSSISYLDASVSLLTGYASGHVAELPLWLTLTPIEKTIPSGPQKGTKKTYYIANLEYRGGYKALRENVQRLLAARNGSDPVKAMERLMEASLALPESPEEQKDVAETFFPE